MVDIAIFVVSCFVVFGCLMSIGSPKGAHGEDHGHGHGGHH